MPLSLTGTSVGLVSVLGYLPDVFAPVLAGWLVVSLPGADGYRAYFWLLAVVALAGLWAARSIAGEAAGDRPMLSAKR